MNQQASERPVKAPVLVPIAGLYIWERYGAINETLRAMHPFLS